MAMITPCLSQKRMKVSKQEALYHHDHHPFPSQKRKETDSHDHRDPVPDEGANFSAEGCV